MSRLTAEEPFDHAETIKGLQHADAKKGRALYALHCASCHGITEASPKVLHDIRLTRVSVTQADDAAGDLDSALTSRWKWILPSRCTLRGLAPA